MAKGLIGVDNVMKNLNKKLSKIKIKSTAGLIEAAIVIRRDMDMTPPLIPVDFGNLRASWFITSGTVTKSAPQFKGDDSSKLTADHSSIVSEAASKAKAIPRPLVIMGFSAGYSRAVENMDNFKDPHRPNSGPKFFLSSIKRNAGKVTKIVAAANK